MANILSIVVAIGMFSGWVVYLAGIARSQNLCVKVGKGNMLTSDLITSVDDPSKAVPISQPWQTAGFGMSYTPTSGRKMLSTGRSLLDVVDNSCGWTYSFEWWTIALQGLAVVGVIFVAITPSKLKSAFASFLYVNTALLCFVAYLVVPIAYNYNQVKAKGPAVDAVLASTAGVIITLIFNFLWFIHSSFEDHAAVQPLAK